MAEKTDMFLTHNWGPDSSGRDNHQRVSVVNEALKGAGYKTWFDNDRMHGNIPQQMAEGIDNTQIVLIFITSKYRDKVNGVSASDNCRLEFQHALNTKTSAGVVCVLMEKCMADSSKWGGILGMYCGVKLYVDMSGDVNDVDYLSKQMELLCNEIQAVGVPRPQGNTTKGESGNQWLDILSALKLKDSDVDSSTTKKGRSSLEFPNKKQAGLGTDGILYAFGTQFGESDYENPSLVAKLVKVTSSTHGGRPDFRGDVHAFTSREATHPHTLDGLHSWYQVELLSSMKVKPSSYKLQSYSNGGGHMLVNWNFEASNDGANWTVLKNHTDDLTIADFGAIGCWDVECEKFYKFFRVLLTGKTKSNTHYLCVSGFELYGSLEITYEEEECLTFSESKQAGLGVDGILYALGTHFNTQDYKNPGTEDHYLTVTTSKHGTGGNCLGEVTAFTGRNTEQSVTLSAIESYCMIELKRGLSVKPSAYKLRSYSKGGDDILINWNFEASNDGVNWTVLKNHTDDLTIADFGTIRCWDVSCRKFYKFFRVLLTGKTKANTLNLCVSGFELYGDLNMKICD